MYLPLSLFRGGFSLAIQMASAVPRRNQSFSLHLTLYKLRDIKIS